MATLCSLQGVNDKKQLIKQFAPFFDAYDCMNVSAVIASLTTESVCDDMLELCERLSLSVHNGTL